MHLGCGGVIGETSAHQDVAGLHDDPRPLSSGFPWLGGQKGHGAYSSGVMSDAGGRSRRARRRASSGVHGLLGRDRCLRGGLTNQR
nr:hypothetical protein pFRL5_368 [Streptomyces sp. F8]